MQLPPPAVIGALVQRYARLLSRYGDEIGERPLVLPNGDFFPDEFRSNERALRRLVKRMQRHAGMLDVPIETRLLEDAGSSQGCGSTGCAAGACAPRGGPCGCGKDTCEDSDGHHSPPPHLLDQGDHWILQIPETETKHPVVLTTQVARSLGFVFLAETLTEGQIIDPPVDVTTDLAAVALGFGVLLLEGSYIYQKSCGGPSVGRATKLAVGELAILVVLFATRGGHPIRAALRELGTTQRAVVREARGWVESNRELTELLREQPGRLASGDFQLADPQPWLLRLIGRKKPSQVKLDPTEALLGGNLDEIESMMATMPAPQRRDPRPPDPQRDELKALVDEALGASPPTD
jgi:hypothetical protein